MEFKPPNTEQMRSKGLLLEGAKFDLNLFVSKAESISLNLVLMENSGTFNDNAKTAELKESSTVKLKNIKPD